MSPTHTTIITDGPLHVAIIMDGNGRWATCRGLPRPEGHRQGADVVRRIVEAAPETGIGVLTLYAFSADNWRRPRGEIETLLAIFDDYLRAETRTCVEHGIRFSLIGRRDRLLPSLRRSAEALEFCSAGGEALHLRLAIDYSGREAIWLAAQRLFAGSRASATDRDAAGPETAGLKTRPACPAPCDPDTEVASPRMAGLKMAGLKTRPTYEEFASRVASGRGEPSDAPDVDLLIRTGGEQRLSDFLLWESAYAELWFTDTAWPDFTAAELALAIEAFSRRERRFGGLPPPIGVASDAEQLLPVTRTAGRGPSSE
jgi:undecaprenyl diphosphate synthase